jgi:hypothetical protein
MTAIWSLPASLSPPLDTRGAITDALYRFVVGLDTSDAALFDSAFTEDVRFEVNGRVTESLATVRTNCYGPVSRLDTTHFVTNVRVNVADAGLKASVSASVLAQHYRAGTGKEAGATRYMTGALYLADLVKDDADGLWKMNNLKMKSTWGEGDFGVLTGS